MRLSPTKPIDLVRKNMVFHFSPDIATRSLRYVTFMNLHVETMISSSNYTSYPQNPFFLDPQKKTFSTYSVKSVIIYKVKEEREIIVGH